MRCMRSGQAIALILLLPVAWMLIFPDTTAESRPVIRVGRATLKTVPPPEVPAYPSVPRVVDTPPPPSFVLPLSVIGSESAPLAMVAISRYLILVTADRAVIAIDIATRRVAWRRGPADLGLAPRHIVAAGSRSVMILAEPPDPPLTLSVMSGTELRRWTHARPQMMQSACTMRGRVVITTADAGPVLSFYDDTGGLRRQQGLPWAGFNTSHPLLRQLLLVNDPSGRGCIGALALGPAMMSFSDTGVAWTAPYREPFQAPTVRVRTIRRPDGATVVESWLVHRQRAAQGLAASGGVVYVAFGGATALAGRIIDMYATGSGAYLGSVGFPHVVRGIAASGHRLYIAVHANGYAVVEGYDLDLAIRR